jgi:type VI secretion system protein ImpC
MAQVAAAAHTPFIAGASPTVMQMSLAGTGQPARPDQDLHHARYAGWRSLRESEDSRYLGLAMPRYPVAAALRRQDDPVEEFDFEEDTGSRTTAATPGRTPPTRWR